MGQDPAEPGSRSAGPETLGGGVVVAGQIDRLNTSYGAHARVGQVTHLEEVVPGVTWRR